MKNVKLKLGIALLSVTFLSSCAQIIGDILFPNQCQVCKVMSWGREVWSEEECGGGQDALEQRCKAKAYDENKWSNNATCECNFK